MSNKGLFVSRGKSATTRAPIAKEPSDYLSAGCTFAAESPLPFFAVHQIAHGDVCTTGCALFGDGKCAAYRRLTAITPIPVEPTETVRQEAARRGISISEVRRQRARSGGCSPQPQAK